MMLMTVLGLAFRSSRLLGIGLNLQLYHIQYFINSIRSCHTKYKNIKFFWFSFLNKFTNKICEGENIGKDEKEKTSYTSLGLNSLTLLSILLLFTFTVKGNEEQAAENGWLIGNGIKFSYHYFEKKWKCVGFSHWIHVPKKTLNTELWWKMTAKNWRSMSTKNVQNNRCKSHLFPSIRTWVLQ